MNKMNIFLNDFSWKRWLIVIICLKALVFLYFSIQLKNHFSETLVGGWAATTGDTPGYYNPAEAMAQGHGYNSTCRMPGIVPIYVPISALLGQENAKVVMIFFQFLVSAISIYLLAKWAFLIFKRRWVFVFTAILFSISSFTSVWDHYLMSDSFSTSFFIFSIFFLQKYQIERSSRALLYAGLFLTWALFFRQIFVVIFPIILVILFIWNWKKWKFMAMSMAVFLFPLILFLGLWIGYCQNKLNRSIVFTSPIEECFSTYSLEYQMLTKFLIDMGYGEPFWIKGSVVEWMIRSEESQDMPNIPDRHFTSECNRDSLVLLRTQFLAFSDAEGTERVKMGEVIREKVKRYSEAYHEEKSFYFLFLNRFRHIQQMLFPLRLDNLPGPAYSEMNIFEKMVKIFYLLLFTVVVSVGSFVMLGLFFTRQNTERWWWMLPLGLIFVLAVVFGYVEQRYLVPVYPFMVVAVAFATSRFIKEPQSN
jgi:hypothetical protein